MKSLCAPASQNLRGQFAQFRQSDILVTPVQGDQFRVEYFGINPQGGSQPKNGTNASGYPSPASGTSFPRPMPTQPALKILAISSSKPC